jgi:hypothetical protein
MLVVAVEQVKFASKLCTAARLQADEPSPNFIQRIIDSMQAGYLLILIALQAVSLVA